MHHNQSDPSSQSEQLFQLLIETMKDYAFLMTDPEGSITNWNPGLERLLGYSENQIAGQPAALIFTPEDRMAGYPAEETAAALRTGRFEGKRWFQRRNGTCFWAHEMVVPVKNADGTLSGFTRIIRDETKQRLTEEKLAEANLRLENILSSLSDSFFTFDREFRYVYVNEATTRMFDLPESAFLGKTLSEVFPDVEGNQFHAEVRRAMDEQKTIVFENYYPPLDRWFENRIYPFAKGLSIFTAEITERKRAEESLRQSEQRYRTLFESIDEGFCVIEVLFDKRGKPSDYRFLESNPSFEKLTGLSSEEALGGRKTARELVPGLEEKWFENYGRVALTGESIRFVEGSEAMNRWFDVYAFRVGEAANCRVAVLFNNITERKKAEITLREAEQRYRALVEATATTVWYASPEGKVTIVPDNRAETGNQSEDEVKQDWFELIHPDERARVIDLWQNALKNNSLFSTEFKILTKSGEYGWIAASAVPICDSEGRIREWVGSHIDINNRKRAEQEREEIVKQLETERSRLAYIFEQAPAFVSILIGAAHTTELANPAYLQMIGHRQIIGKQIREALPDIAGQGYFELLDQVYQTGEPFIGREQMVEFQYTPESEPEKRFVDFVLQPIFTADRKVLGIFIHGVDITEQVEARQQAENANRLKDEFLATLSHELRTPLNAILGWSQLLKNQILGEAEKQTALDTIVRSARSQNQLIDDLLDVSRIITGKLRLDVRTVELPNVIIGAVEAARPAADGKNIRLQTLLDPQAGPVSGDPDRLQQVVWNLLSNAIKFTPKDGRVQIRLERINSHLEIIVSDTGRGIEPEFLPFVFDRFRQSDGSTTRRHGGLGLGLAIVRQLVEQHGGTVSVESAGENQGSIFTVKLPLLPVRLPAAGDQRRVHPAVKSAENHLDCAPELAGLRVLIVDDEADSRDLLNQVLSLRGAQTVTAGSAGEALEIVQDQKFDVIVSDIGMPEEDGFYLISKIRKLSREQGGQVPAIALTAYARAEDRVQSIRAGFQMHIAKPVEPSELIALVASCAGQNNKSEPE